jgi:hypothetical protein
MKRPKELNSCSETLVITISPDGKTHTIATTGIDASGQQINNISVYDKQLVAA